MMMLMVMSLAAGQVAAPPRAPHGGPAGRGMDRFFDMADTDHDGKLSRAEFAVARERFRGMRQAHMERRAQRMQAPSGR
jgi:hypothetical protein